MTQSNDTPATGGAEGASDGPHETAKSSVSKSVTEAPSKHRSGKSAKDYRLERDAAIAKSGLQDVESLMEYMGGKLDPQRIELLRKQAQEATNAVIFKATDALIKQGRLIHCELGDTFTLEFRV